MKLKIIRYSLGFIFLATILLAIKISKYTLLAVSIVFIFFALKEYRKMFEAKNIQIHKYIPEFISILCAIFFVANYQNYITPCLVFGIFLAFAATILKNKKPYMITTFSTIMGFMLSFCTLYIIKLFYFFNHNQISFILIYFFAVLAGDYCASKAGPKFGKKLLAPDISPNKTIVGSIANFSATFLMSLLLIPTVKFNILGVLIFAFSTSLCSQIGDLAISTIKRDLGLKHSGGFFLNYGGILDRVDAFIFSAPAAFYATIFISTYL